jgi:hypothetical protein
MIGEQPTAIEVHEALRPNFDDPSRAGRDTMNEKTVIDFLESLDVLRNNINLFHQGNLSSYRVVAAELRKLLCDGKRSLIPRVFSDFRPHKFQITKTLERAPSLAAKLRVGMPGQLEVKSGRSRFSLLFADPLEQMDLEPWLEQPFVGPATTVRKLIRTVADKEGVHADPDYPETLKQAKAVKYAGDESHKHCIVALGEYILRYLSQGELQVRPNIPLHRMPPGDTS